MRIHIKPMSVNKVWQGKRFKTPAYKSYEVELMALLPKNLQIDFKGDLSVEIVFGFSSKLADIDNPLKPLLDVLQKYYGFNDRQITKIIVEKEIVKKGDEFIDVKINTKK